MPSDPTAAAVPPQAIRRRPVHTSWPPSLTNGAGGRDVQRSAAGLYAAPTVPASAWTDPNVEDPDALPAEDARVPPKTITSWPVQARLAEARGPNGESGRTRQRSVLGV